MAKNPTEYGTSPVGRIISGDPWTKQQTDANNRPIPPEKQNFWFALAVEKNAPGVNEMLGTMYSAAMAGYASAPHVQAQIQQGLTAPQFSWKVDDGDEMRVNAQTGAQEHRWKHGAGCWVFKFSTTLPIRAAKWQGNVPVDADPSEIKRGYFAQVAYSTSANSNTDHTAGVYLNPQTVCLVGMGEEIVGGPSLEQQFGQGPSNYRPAGMSNTPVPPTGAAPLSNAGMPAAQPQPMPAAQPQPMPAAQPQPMPAAQPQPLGNAPQTPTPLPSGTNTATTSHGEPMPVEQPAPGGAVSPYGGYMQPAPGGGGMPGT